MPPLPVYVLIGGASSRFGADKATTPVEGEPWALHVGRRLAYGDAEIVLVGSGPDDKATVSPCRRIDDAAGVEGPLAGVLAALSDRRHLHGDGLLTLASCDLVRPQREWLAPLVAAHQADGSLGLAAYFGSERWQPFPSVAHTRWLKPLAEAAGSGRRSFQSVLATPLAAAIPWTGAAGGPPQANSPDELQKLLTTS